MFIKFWHPNPPIVENPVLADTFTKKGYCMHLRMVYNMYYDFEKSHFFSEIINVCILIEPYTPLRSQFKV